MGGGNWPHPVEILLAHRSVLFLDELPEFEPVNNVLHTALGGLRSRRMSDGQPDHLDTNRITSLALLTGSNILATGDLTGVIHIWSLDNWQELATLSGHRQYISSLVFSPDGSSLLSVSTDGTMHLWGLP